MDGSNAHTVRAFDDDLHDLRACVAEIGGLAEAAVYSALKALVEGDESAAAMIVADDRRIDDLAETIERQCIRLIALRAPMADDLREILGAFKISVLVERMGDCARNIAEQVPRLKAPTRPRQARILKEMQSAVGEMMRGALDAFIARDASACALVCASDAAIDNLHDDLFRELVDMMNDNPSSIGDGTGLLLASLKLERIGDHAANIARVVHYSVTGSPLEGSASRAASAFEAA